MWSNMFLVIQFHIFMWNTIQISKKKILLKIVLVYHNLSVIPGIIYIQLHHENKATFLSLCLSLSLLTGAKQKVFHILEASNYYQLWPNRDLQICSTKHQRSFLHSSYFSTYERGYIYDLEGYLNLRTW